VGEDRRVTGGTKRVSLRASGSRGGRILTQKEGSKLVDKVNKENKGSKGNKGNKGRFCTYYIVEPYLMHVCE
jgi:hypothetical protein